MSCRLIRADRPESSRPLFASSQPDGGEETDWVLPDSPAAAGHGEVKHLKERIQELERALPIQAEQARRAGIQEGQAAAAERAEASIAPVVEKLSRAIAEIAGLRARIREETERDLVALSVAVARRILRRELTIDPDAVQGLIRAAMDKLGNRDITKVRIYPGHEAAIRQCLASIGGAAIEVIRDPGLQAGDVIFETRRGNLDISIDTQLAEIERGFADRIAK